MEVSIYRYLLLSLVWPLIASCGYYVTSYPRLLLLSLLWPSYGLQSVVSVACLLLLRLLLLVVTVIRGVPTVAPAGPRGYPQAVDQQGGGDFSKRGERQTETQPVPIFMREVEKNVVFQRKQR